MSNSDSPLHIAVRNNDIDIAKIILQNQGDVHAVNAEGLTPLQVATQAGNTEMIALLLQHGAGRQANSVPPPQPNPYIGNTSVPPPMGSYATPQKSLNPRWIIGGCVAVVLLVLLMLPLIGSGGGQTIEEFAKDFSSQINKELNTNPSNEVFKTVELAHVSVTCKKGSVSKCIVETLDGSNFAGHNGSNISRVQFCITVYWDGFLHKDGHTVVEFVLDVPNNNMMSVQIIETDAVVNTTDPKLWFAAGVLVGEVLVDVLMNQ